MPPITEAKLFEAFGLTPPQGEGAKEQGIAAPAAEGIQADPEEGAQGQEFAEPADQTARPAEEPAADQDPETEGADPAAEEPAGKKTLTPEERRANAARRRQKEQQEAIDRAVAEARRAEQEKQQAMLQDVFARAGLKDNATGKPITSLEEFNQWHKAFTDGQLQKELKAGKLTKESLEQLIEQHPAVQQAKQLMEQGQTAQRQQQEAADKARIDGELKEISAMDPSIRSVADLLNMPTADKFREYVAKGLGFKDAFYLANRESLEQARAAAARQQAMNNQRGKEHLIATGNPRGGGADAVPSDQMRLFRMLNPNATEQEIQNYYNKYKSNQGG